MKKYSIILLALMLHIQPICSMQIATPVQATATNRLSALLQKYPATYSLIGGLCLYALVSEIALHARKTQNIMTNYNIELCNQTLSPLTSYASIAKRTADSVIKDRACTEVGTLNPHLKFSQNCQQQLLAFSHACAIDNWYNGLSTFAFIAWVGAHLWQLYHSSKFNTQTKHQWFVVTNFIFSIVSLALTYKLHQDSKYITDQDKIPFGCDYKHLVVEHYLQQNKKRLDLINQQRAQDLEFIRK